MKSTEMLSRLYPCRRFRFLSLLIALAALGSACTDGSSGTAEPDPTPTLAATSTVVEIEPTATPAASDTDRIDAAVQALNESGAGDLVAWDVLDSAVNDDGLVTLTLCGWTGDTVFDAVRRSLWTTEHSSGEVTATELGTSLTSGECLNTELIESALETRRQFEAYWADVLSDPSTFPTDERGEALLTQRYSELAAEATAQWDADGVTFQGLSFNSETEAAPSSWRRFRLPEDERLELASCREMSSSYGIFIDGVQADGFPPDPPSGMHSIDSLVLVTSASSPTGWRVRFVDNLSWADCTGDAGWPTSASEWRTAPSDFTPVSSS